MTRCERFEREGLLRIEQGLPLDPHFDSCPDCLEARRAYTRLTHEIAELDATVEPLAGWQERVWTRIRRDRQESRSESRGAWRLARWLIPVGAVAAVALFTFWPSALPAPAPPSIQAEILSGQATVRGLDAHPGDQLRVRATMSGHERAELRIYFNGLDVIATCSAIAGVRTVTGPCLLDGDALVMTTTLKSLGTYQPVLIVSAQAVPGSAGNMNQDIGAAIQAGAQVKPGDPIAVR